MHREAVIAALARRQHGVVARAQLLRSGVPSHVIDYRVKLGRLHCLYRGIYRVGPLPARFEREMAAVLACGETAMLSHRSAAVLWGILADRGDRDPVEVTIQRGQRASRGALRVHRTARIGPDEVTHIRNIPVTIPARTILDIASSSAAREVEQALAGAERRRLLDRDPVAPLLERYPRRSGTRLLRVLLARSGDPAYTRSEAESRFLGLVRRARLDAPDVNVRLKGYEVDFLWRPARLVAEIDGFAFHSSSRAFEGDRRRDAVLSAAGFRVVRITWRQLTTEPEAVLVRLAQALARADAP